MDDSLEQDEGQAELEAIALELQGEHICIGDLISCVLQHDSAFLITRLESSAQPEARPRQLLPVSSTRRQVE